MYLCSLYACRHLIYDRLPTLEHSTQKTARCPMVHSDSCSRKLTQLAEASFRDISIGAETSPVAKDMDGKCTDCSAAKAHIVVDRPCWRDGMFRQTRRNLIL